MWNVPKRFFPLFRKAHALSALPMADGTLCDVQYAERHFDDFTMYYFVNTYSGKERAVFETNGASAVRFNYDTGETEPFAFTSENGVLTADIELEPKGLARTFCL